MGTQRQCWGPQLPPEAKGHHFLLEVVEITFVVSFNRKVNCTTDRCVQGWLPEKPDEAGVKAMLRSRAVLERRKTRVDSL